MIRLLAFVLGIGVALELVAAPAAKVAPVASGFPDWRGLTPKAHITGREVTPSDLRHKVTIVIDLELGEKLDEQLVLAFQVARYGLLVMGEINWEFAEVPRDVIAVVSVHGARHDAYLEALKPDPKRDKETTYVVKMMATYPTYDAITFTGAPDNGGRLPAVYVMGPTGTEPLFKGALDAEGVKGAVAAVVNAKKEIGAWTTKWRPFFGNIAEPRYNTSLKKALEKGRTAKKVPLDPILRNLLEDVESPDPEKAREAQVLYDAICQTRSELLQRIDMEAKPCPHRAWCDVQTLFRHWPPETKRLEGALAQMKAVPQTETLGKMLARLLEIDDPSFTVKSAAEAKKVVNELAKMKKTLAPLKESKTVVVQNGAVTLDVKIDELLPLVPGKVAVGK